MNDPIVIDRTTLNALLALAEKEVTRAGNLARLARDPNVAVIHQDAASTIHALVLITRNEMRSLIITDDVYLAPTRGVETEDTHADEIADAANNHGQDDLGPGGCDDPLML